MPDELTPSELRAEAARLREIAARYEELANMLEGIGALEHRSKPTHAGKTSPPADQLAQHRKGEAWKKVILAAATFGSESFAASEVVAAAKDLPEQTVYAVFRRDQGKLFKAVGTDPNNERITKYKLKGFNWVFVYGINMNAAHLRKEFARRGFDFDSLTLGALPAEMPGAKLSWRNKSQKWNGGTATFDDDDESEVTGIAYLARGNDGIKAFEAQAAPRYVREQRNIVVGGRLVSALTFNVARRHRQSKDVSPSKEYVDLMLDAAREYKLAPILQAFRQVK